MQALVRDDPKAYYMVLTLMIFVLSETILLLIFIPKMILARRFLQMTEEEQRREMSEQITKSSRNVSAVGNSSRGSNNFPDRASEAFALAAKQAQQHYQSGNKGGTGGGNAIQTPNKPATEHEIIFEKDSQISEVTGTSTTRSYPLPKTSSAVPSEFSATFSIAEDPKEAEEILQRPQLLLLPLLAIGISDNENI